mmetsp:Transcript_36738/g.35490  ORF Transcript_36738/g.35490 Transcript_36738/m.35490 type:complete len:80 (+) Transcript_36738:50-289(+)
MLSALLLLFLSFSTLVQSCSLITCKVGLGFVFVGSKPELCSEDLTLDQCFLDGCENLGVAVVVPFFGQSFVNLDLCLIP